MQAVGATERRMAWSSATGLFTLAFLALGNSDAPERIRLSSDGRSFVREPSGRPFLAWGFNYDHDRHGRLLEDYWEAEWETVREDFREMKALGANVVRVHLQFGKFMDAPDRPRAAALARLEQLLELARETRLYLDLTGLGCYDKSAVPDWYDAMDTSHRWAAQAVFWSAIAQRCAGRAEVWCYDLMNEPILPPAEGTRDWLAGPLDDKFYVQRIARTLEGRARQELAHAWVRTLVRAIRQHDRDALVCVGEIPWTMVFPGAAPVFFTEATSNLLDFAAIHVYPKTRELERATRAIKVYGALGRPVVIEEIFPLACTPAELETWMLSVRDQVAGFIGFYWGQTLQEYAAEPSIPHALARGWLELFQRWSPDGPWFQPRPPSSSAGFTLREPLAAH